MIERVRRQVRPDLLSYASIDAHLSGHVELLPPDAVWRFFRGREEPSQGLAWTRREGFDDSRWEEGAGGFGYGESGHGTDLADMHGSYTTLYLRRALSLPDVAKYRGYRLRIRADDAFVAYVNGQEAGRHNVGEPGQRLPFNATASEGAAEPLIAQEILIDRNLLVGGKNIVALQGLNRSLSTSSDFSLSAVLDAVEIDSSGQEVQRLESFRSQAKGEGDERRVTYFEGRVHQRARDFQKAVAIFRRLGDVDPDRPEPRERLSECLRNRSGLE